MARLNLIVEGPTEETFVNEILSPYLSVRGVYPRARSIETGRRRAKIYRGGMTNYIRAKNDILRWSKQDSKAFITTMFDFYALPNNFPGYDEAKKKGDPYKQVSHLQQKLKEDLGIENFIPYIQLHEFEALLFSNINKIDACMELYSVHGKVQQLRDSTNHFETPEHINTSPETAPSKILENIYPPYDKVFLGSLISGEIGLEDIKKHCVHFSDWLDQISSISDEE